MRSNRTGLGCLNWVKVTHGHRPECDVRGRHYGASPNVQSLRAAVRRQDDRFHRRWRRRARLRFFRRLGTAVIAVRLPAAFGHAGERRPAAGAGAASIPPTASTCPVNSAPLVAARNSAADTIGMPHPRALAALPDCDEGSAATSSPQRLRELLFRHRTRAESSPAEAQRCRPRRPERCRARSESRPWCGPWSCSTPPVMVRPRARRPVPRPSSGHHRSLGFPSTRTGPPCDRIDSLRRGHPAGSRVRPRLTRAGRATLRTRCRRSPGFPALPPAVPPDVSPCRFRHLNLTKRP